MPILGNAEKQKMYKKLVWGWESGEMKSIAALKKDVLLEPKEVAGIKFPFVCAPLKPWIIRFCKIFRAAKWMLDLYEGNEDTASKPFDYESMNGILSLKSIKKALEGKSRVRLALLEFIDEPEVDEVLGTTRSVNDAKARDSDNAEVANKRTAKDRNAKKICSCKETSQTHEGRGSCSGTTIRDAGQGRGPEEDKPG
ncbi:hypothetical protein PHLCEN_2v9773 [Hermanssonia centrifuga]|uniref:Uncharacterized protein n=1 Tax=Hermanssonia centrifuga TaxID=98765 RepID=A0A2R6NPZ6_9APHY|nr:hypothetical protein PHLCEN_2v9773 [Hermanssonia centrifuga]